MTYSRRQLIPTGSPGTFHCVSRCVRRAFLSGQDKYSGESFEWVEDRLHQLAEIFAVSIWHETRDTPFSESSYAPLVRFLSDGALG